MPPMMSGSDSEPLIDPEVRAIVFSLVSALGGSSAGEDGLYVLGDDALAVLKDIKRWLRLYDDKTNRLDVARLLAEANLVQGDLLPILASWPEAAHEGSFRGKVALLCVDLLTQLTWPVQKDDRGTTLDHFLHIPYLQTAQANYKQEILHYDSNDILRSIVRVGLPAMAEQQKERSPVEENIIKVVLYLVRNVALITSPANVVWEDDTDISRSATLDAFHNQGIFDLLLTVGSAIPDEFKVHDVELLDILFHLVKGIDVDTLFFNSEELITANTNNLQSLMRKERSMHAEYQRNAPTRHNRFGTMLWIKREDGRHSTIFGQKSLASEQATMHEMDKSKKWKKPRRPARKGASDPQDETGVSATLTSTARSHFRRFVEDFLDSSFNPLFMAVRRTIELEADRVLDYHKRQYFYLISWFLRAERTRRQKRAELRSQLGRENQDDTENYTLVASVLNQETFVLLNRSMQNAQDQKNWSDVAACMQCFTQILLTIQEMTSSPHEDDQEIGENTLNRIFYEQSTHDRIVALLRTAKDQPFGYLDAVTELSHVFLRVLEHYSKQNVDMQVRRIRRTRKKKPAPKQSEGGDHLNDREQDAADVADAHRVSSERKFEFSKYAVKFVNQGSVDTFVAFLRHYRDLGDEQMKRAHRFFHRAAFKMDLTSYLFRLDIIALFQKMIRGPEGLPNDLPGFREWEELIRQVLRRFVRKMEARPCLAVEVLFSKIPSSIFFLEHGFEREIPKKIQRPPAELEIKPGMDREQQIGVAVSILVNQQKSDLLSWLKQALTSAAEERQDWESAHLARESIEKAATRDEEVPAIVGSPQEPSPEHQDVAQPTDQPAQDEQPKAPSILLTPPSPESRTATQRDKYLRLLLTVIGLHRLDYSDSTDSDHSCAWTIPSDLSATTLTTTISLISATEFAPPSYPDNKSAQDFTRRKADTLPSRPHHTTTTTDPNDSEGSTHSTLSALEASLSHRNPDPLNWHTSPDPQKPPTGKRKRKRRTDGDAALTDAAAAVKRETRRQHEAERIGKIKSALYITKSDDESDEEGDRAFFEREARMREQAARGVKSAAAASKRGREAAEGGGEEKARKRQRQKRKQAATVLSGDDGEEAEAEAEASEEMRRQIVGYDSWAESDNDNDNDTITSNSQSPRQSQPLLDDDSEASTDTETPPSSQRPSSRDDESRPGIPSSRQIGKAGGKAGSRESGGESDKENDIVAASRGGIGRRGRRVVDDDDDDEEE
ncbi:MAG: Topoisomerase 1-associated factor 1 [Chrysothrix sp. TS-e1954]|nr:MAG: Topoisomerase 1-associated factor 1 [Chrysothrix sp. TS-e1954]